MSLTLRSTKGSPLTNAEADANFSGLADGFLLTGIQASSGSSLVGFSQTPAATTGTVGAKLQQVISVKDAPYNAKGDGVTDDTTFLSAADASGATDLYTPTGTYISTLASTALTKNYGGPGRIKVNANYHAKYFSVLSAVPSSYGVNAFATMFNGDLSHQAFSISKQITGATTLTQPATGYFQKPESSAVFIGYENDSGWAQNTGSGDGTTGASAITVAAFNTANSLGATICFTAQCTVLGAKVGATSWSANPAAVLYTGEVDAAAAGVYLNPFEVALRDNGFDVAGIGAVYDLYRTNNTGALTAFWTGVRVQSLGSKDIDAGFQATGLCRYGIDLTPATINAANHGAILLKQNDRIYLNATAGTYFAGGVGTSWIEYNSAAAKILIQVGGTTTAQFDAAGFIYMPSGGGVAVNGVQVLTNRRAGWTAPTGTLSRATFDQSTVTLPELAKRLAALIVDLGISSGMGILDA